ncbi:MAG: vWA domain-containing protein [Chloroflexota bacterium]|nr:vWA domain-containing protein [Chloroflexota bacterium]
MLTRRLLLLLVLLAVWWGLPQPALAQQDPDGPVDVMLLVDDSGSMSDRWAGGTRAPNDPEGLRHSAARMFIDLATDGDRVGVISFHTDPSGLGETAEGRLTTIAGAASKRDLQSAIVQPTTPAPEERLTDIRKALGLASDILEANQTGNRQYIVFLTDGRPWPPDQRSELFAKINQLADQGVTIFPVLLGNDVDLEVAERMAQKTNGLIQSIDRPGDLLPAYAKIYGFVQPERYVNEVDLADGRLATFRTSPDQGITSVSVIVPKAPETAQGYTDLSLNGQSILDREILDNGATVVRNGDTHYDVVTLEHNAPLVGEWTATTAGTPDGEARALLVADSAASLVLQYPGADDIASTAAPRFYPAGKPVLLAAAVEQAGRRSSDLQVQAVVDGVQHPMQASGLADDGSLFWTIVSPDKSNVVGESTPVEVQIGNEVTPIRLWKEFSLVAADLPRLLADSPTERASGLLEDGRMLLRARFDGETPPAQARVVAFVSDSADETVTSVEIPCNADGICEDRSFVPIEGRRYDVVFVTDAIAADGTPYTDFAQGGLTMRDALRMDSLPPILDFGQVPTYEDTIQRELVLTALTDEAVELDAELELTSPGLEVPPGALGMTLSQPTHKEGDRYVSMLQLTGFDALPPGEYGGRIRFSSSEGVAVEPSAVALQFSIPTPEIDLTLPASTDLGDLARAGEPRQFNVQATFSGEASDIQAQLVEFTSGGRAVDSGDFQVRVGTAQPEQAGSHRHNVPVYLSAVTRPKPGLYQGTIQFSSPEGLSVEPHRMQVAFNVPQPVTSFLVPGDLLDFGASANLAQPISTSLTLNQSILDQPPLLQITMLDLNHDQLEAGSVEDLTVSTGTARALGDGTFELPLFVSSAGRPVPGLYQGRLRVETLDDVLLQPSEFGFLVRQLTPLQVWQQRLSPVASFLTTWFVPLPFPRFQGLVGWLLLLLLINTLLRLRPGNNQTKGVIHAEETGKEASVRDNSPLYLVTNGSNVVLSHKKQDRPRALATVSFEQQVDTRDEQLVWRPVVRPNPLAPEDVRLAYWQRKSNRWRLIKEDGQILWNGARIRLRLPDRGARYHFRYAID